MTQASGELGERDPELGKIWEPLEKRIWGAVNKRVSFAEASPEPGFNPLEASPEQLERFKLPPRPDRERNPRAFANWRRAMSPPLRFVPPEVLEELVADPTKPFMVARGYRQRQFLSGAAPAQQVSRNWSGAYIRSNPGERYVLIQATWMVPRPYPPPPAASGAAWLRGDYYSSAWIGLDGHDPASRSLPQIGTAQRVSLRNDTSNPSDLTAEVGAWWQWWVKDDPLNHPIEIPQAQFAVQSGDLIYAQVNVLDSTTVRFFLKNRSSGQVFSPFDVTAPVSPNNNHVVTVEGRTAAWILEQPTQPQSTGMLPFCDYGVVAFYACNAQVAISAPAGTTLDDRQLRLARLIRLADWTPNRPGVTDQPRMHQPGIILSSAAREGNDSVLSYYRGNG